MKKLIVIIAGFGISVCAFAQEPKVGVGTKLTFQRDIQFEVSEDGRRYAQFGQGRPLILGDLDAQNLPGLGEYCELSMGPDFPVEDTVVMAANTRTILFLDVATGTQATLAEATSTPYISLKCYDVHKYPSKRVLTEGVLRRVFGDYLSDINVVSAPNATPKINLINFDGSQFTGQQIQEI